MLRQRIAMAALLFDDDLYVFRYVEKLSAAERVAELRVEAAATAKRALEAISIGAQ
jgi:hypothetical protein